MERRRQAKVSPNKRRGRGQPASKRAAAPSYAMPAAGDDDASTEEWRRQIAALTIQLVFRQVRLMSGGFPEPCTVALIAHPSFCSTCGANCKKMQSNAEGCPRQARQGRPLSQVLPYQQPTGSRPTSCSPSLPSACAPSSSARVLSRSTASRSTLCPTGRPGPRP